MRASYMKHFAKFLAILHHNASFFNFCFIINFGFIKNLLHIFEILKSLSHITLLLTVNASARVVRFSAITMHDLANVYQKVNNYSFIVVFGSKQKLPQPTLHFLKNYGNLLHNCLIFISNMPHNGFIYEARMDMMENSGHCYLQV